MSPATGHYNGSSFQHPPMQTQGPMYATFFRGNRRQVLLRAAVLTAVIAIADWRTVDEIPLSILYLLPMMMVGSVLDPWQIGGLAALCMLLAEAFDAFTWHPRTGVTRDILYFVAFFGVSMFTREVHRNRRAAQEHLEQITTESEARREAEEQLRVLIESSPAAIITADSDGTVLMANDAAHRLLALPAGDLPGRSVHAYFPSLAHVPRLQTSQQYRTTMQSRGRRADGEVFLADISFSTYATHRGTRLAAMILDTSEDMRTREETSLQQMLAGSRIAAAAVSHEVRNVSGAISVVHQNLTRSGLLSRDKDFEALGNLLHALERIAAVDLRQYTDQSAEVDLIAVLDDLRIVVAPALCEAGIACRWSIPAEIPTVWADRQNLLQVFLNVTSNGIRALAGRKDPEMAVSARLHDHCVLVEFVDNGGGVAHPDRLFHPFQQEADVTGLGLFLSRALMRACRGELRYKAVDIGACFVVEMPIVESPEISL